VNDPGGYANNVEYIDEDAGGGSGEHSLHGLNGRQKHARFFQSFITRLCHQTLTCLVFFPYIPHACQYR
jgi:hypothetical protein